MLALSCGANTNWVSWSTKLPSGCPKLRAKGAVDTQHSSSSSAVDEPWADIKKGI